MEEEDVEAEERRYARAAAREGLRPDPHCALRHGGFAADDGDGGEAAVATGKPWVAVPPPTRPKPFVDLQFRDRARLCRPTVAWQGRAWANEHLAALDRRRHAGAHVQPRAPGFPPVLDEFAKLLDP